MMRTYFLVFEKTLDKIGSAKILRKLPIGIQDFEKLITKGFIYVDKTEYIYQLVQQNTPIFLSRPRRFGKSLLISTMKAYWQGKKELFKGLKIEELIEQTPPVNSANSAWLPYPVFHFDFDGGFYSNNSTALESRLAEHLRFWEREYNINPYDFRNMYNVNKEERLGGLNELGVRFRYLMMEAHRQTGQRVVVLVDEYDKPLLEVMQQPELEQHNKSVFKGFFGSLKAADEYLEFLFITGVTKFEKVSIFSDLNQLEDISLDEEYAGICGITEKELQDNFLPEIKRLAEKQKISESEAIERLKITYDGYHFSSDFDVRVYNPFSLLNSLKKRKFDHYWFSTGTPTFLAKRMVKNSFDVRKLMDGTLYADEQRLSYYRADNVDLVPLLYQSGYLTIMAYDEKRRRYSLSFPNEEVKYGMLNSLLSVYVPQVVAKTGLDIFSLDEKLENGDLDGVKNIFIGLFASIPYPNIGDDTARDPFENYFQGIFAVTLTLLGQFVVCEQHIATGRIDCVIRTEQFIYIFEFKRDDSAENALKQIEDNGYALPFVADKRTLYKIGVVFDSKNRTLKDWKVAE